MGQPEWTNHDVSDPGITLANVSAFLADPLDWARRRKVLLVALAAAVGLLWLLRRDDG
jgi:hypothetical protein